MARLCADRPVRPLGRSDLARPSSPRSPPHAGVWCGLEGKGRRRRWAATGRRAALHCFALYFCLGSPTHPPLTAAPTQRRGAAPLAARQVCSGSFSSQGEGPVERARSGVASSTGSAPRDTWPQRKPPTSAAGYGVDGFLARLKQGLFYVDQTAHLAKLDGIQRAVLLRPPRWGKTLWLSMMECHYGVAHNERFGELFGGLDIVRRAKELQPDTSLQSSFHKL